MIIIFVFVVVVISCTLCNPHVLRKINHEVRKSLELPWLNAACIKSGFGVIIVSISGDLGRIWTDGRYPVLLRRSLATTLFYSESVLDVAGLLGLQRVKSECWCVKSEVSS